MATARHCRGCGQVHDLLMPCPKPLPKTLADLETLKAFTKAIFSRPAPVGAASASNQRCPTCKQRIKKPKKRKKAKRA